MRQIKEKMYHMETNKQSYVTHQIAQAMIQLLEEKPLIDITVTEITKKAQVGRASFYRHFGSTSDVLDYLIDDIFLRLHELFTPIFNSTDSGTWRNFLFQYIYFLNSPDRELFVFRDENVSILLNRLVNRIRMNLRDDEHFTIQEKYNLTSKISLINGVLLKWKETGMKETPEEIINYLMCIIDFYHQMSDTVIHE